MRPQKLTVMRLSAIFLVLLLLCSQSTLSVRAQMAQSAKPKLVLLLMIDQFNFDYLSRFEDRLGNNGFKFLLENGANFVNCRYRQATTQTAVGHAVVSSGAYPWSSGVVANAWYDRRKRKDIEAVSDDNAQLVGANGAGASSKVLLGSTIGDELKLATNGRAKVFSLSLKDRAALFMAGKLANGAYWFDQRTGSFVSSSQYGPSLSNWVRSFNDQHYADRYFGKAWQRLLPETNYLASTRDDYLYEQALPGDGRQFPHVINGALTNPGPQFYSTFVMTPWANQMLVDLGKEAIDKESLGQRGDTDLLSISFSAPDYLGHSFGPYSQEIEDMYLRLDQSLGQLFQYVDEKIGLQNCLIVLSSDHGVMPIPEFLKERGQDAGRIDPASFRNLLDAALDQKLGKDDWIESFQPPNLYLNLDTIDRQKYRQPDVEALAAKLARSIPGIGEVYTAYQFFMNQLPAGPHVESVKRSYYWGRSGELYILPKPGFIFSGGSQGTSHGSPYSYDSQVPLLLCGPQVSFGRYGSDASPADISATISAILQINTPSLCEGRALSEALGQLHGPPRPFALSGITSSSEPGK